MTEIDWVEIPAGEFLMGLSDEQVEAFRERFRAKLSRLDRLLGKDRLLPSAKKSWLEDERPQRVVHLNTFYIARFPITEQQYRAQPTLKQPRHFYPDTQRLPVPVNWEMAHAFCQHIGARLPTSPEWEKSARGTGGRLYPWGNEWDADRGNFRRIKTAFHVEGTWMTPVDAFPGGVSPYGVWDMAGNVFEITTNLPELTGIEGKCAVLRSWPVKLDHEPLWFTHRISQQLCSDVDSVGGWRYVGFRPVLDKWKRQQW
jgi:formylglycine-generating enzyme required for sulfatase activity